MKAAYYLADQFADAVQVTKISLYSLGILCHQNAQGFGMCGYTVRPGFSNGLILSDRVAPLSGYKGF